MRKVRPISIPKITGSGTSETVQIPGSVITSDGYCDQDTKCRIAMGKTAFITQKKLLISKLDIELRKGIVKTTM